MLIFSLLTQMNNAYGSDGLNIGVGTLGGSLKAIKGVSDDFEIYFQGHQSFSVFSESKNEMYKKDGHITESIHFYDEKRQDRGVTLGTQYIPLQDFPELKLNVGLMYNLGTIQARGTVNEGSRTETKLDEERTP